MAGDLLVLNQPGNCALHDSSIHRLWQHSSPHRTIHFVARICTATIAANAAWAFAATPRFRGQGNQFLQVDEALPFSHSTEENAVVLSWDITPGHYLYRDRISIRALDEGSTAGALEYSSSGTETEDEYFGKTTVFFDPVEATVPVTLPANMREARFEVTYQGCAEAGLCYPPQTREVLFYQSQDSGAGRHLQPERHFKPERRHGSTPIQQPGLRVYSEQSTLVIAGVFSCLAWG